MYEFLMYFDEKVHDFPMHLNIYYSKIVDWCIEITKVGCASDYPDCLHDGNDVVIVREQDLDIGLAFARAHIALKEWLSEYEGGY